MPEGDTIHRAAARMRPALVGRPLVRFEAPRWPGSTPPAGTTVEEVEAVGKHLLVRFADGHVLRTHLRMSGRWDLYAPGERWRRPVHQARAVIEVEGAVAVCFSAPVVEVVRTRRRAPGPADGPGGGPPPVEPAGGVAAGVAGVAHLGPDLCRADADLDAVVARMSTVAHPSAEVADVLLDQRVAAGIGNVFKSEVLWACRVHPFTQLADVDEATRRRLVDTAARQLRVNLTTRRRTTVAGPAGSLAVYRRARRPCRRCGTPIAYRRSGPMARGTYWCPRCQPPPNGEGSATPA